MATKQPTSHLVLLRDEHSGRDEMNLAGHPFALLHSPHKCNATSICYDWKRQLDGREVTASWRVETPAAYGLPGPEEELLYLVLLQLTREAAEENGTPAQWPLQVKFSRGDLLRRMGWDIGARRYAALELAFNRLVAVSIAAKYAFYDARTKAPASAVTFHILNEFSLVDEPRGRKSQSHLPLSHFEWNTTLHTSFLAGNVRSLALDFAISLDCPSSRRLFRLLELLRFASKPPRPKINIGLFKLRDRLGMTPYKYPSKIAEKLKPATEELIGRGYLESCVIEQDATGAPMAVFSFAKLAAALPPGSPPESPSTTKPASGGKEAVMLPPLDLGFARLLPDMAASATLSTPTVTEIPTQGCDAALDRFFEGLSEDERTDIDALAVADLPEFLRDNRATTGAKLGIARFRRREVAYRYPEAKG